MAPTDHETAPLDPRTTAVVLLEFQQQWTEPGIYHRLIQRQLQRRAVVATAARFVADARALGAVVLHAPLVLDPSAKRGAFAHLTRARVFRAGSRRARLTAGLWADGDALVTGRTAFDAFVGSTLEAELLARGCQTLLVAGFTTDQCVARTLRTATRKGFDVRLLGDCCAASTQWLHRREERRWGPRTLTAAQARTALTRWRATGREPVAWPT